MDSVISIARNMAAHDLVSSSALLPIVQPIGLLHDTLFRDQVRAALESVASLPVNRRDGPRVRAGRYHIKLREAIWDTAVTGLSSLASALEPTPLTKAAAAAKILDYLASMRKYLQELSPSEISIYDAVADIVGAKKRSGVILQIREVSEREIRDHLTSNGASPPGNLKDILNSLVTKGGLTPVFRETDETYYTVVF